MNIILVFNAAQAFRNGLVLVVPLPGERLDDEVDVGVARESMKGRKVVGLQGRKSALLFFTNTLLEDVAGRMGGPYSKMSCRSFR
jgi:hypothetical protein